MGDAAEKQFVDEVFQAELEEIKRRRAEVRTRVKQLDDTPSPHPREITHGENARPSVAHGLVGLSLSGGGIRSAAFSLGVLQALHAEGIFPHIDYLSTVSGGGWIGSCLSALMRAPDATFPFVPPYFRQWFANDAAARNPVLEHLRDRASALVPSGFSGGAGMLARVIRGSLITLAMLMATFIVPALLLALLVRVDLRVLAFTTQRLTTGEPPWSSFMVLTPRIVGGSVLLLLLVPVLRTAMSASRRANADTPFVRLFALCLASFAFETHVFVTYRVSQRIDAAHLNYRTFFAPMLHWLRHALTPNATTLAALGALALLLFALRSALRRVLPLLRVAALGLVALGSLAPLYLFVLYISVFESGVGYAAGTGIALDWNSAMVLVSLLGLVFIVLMDTNEASLHGMFRRQISNLFILKTAPGDPKGAMEPDPWVPLSGLSGERSMAPYHLLNAALNLQGSTDPSLRGRNSDFFIFSKRFIGGPRTGYCKTKDLEAASADLDLGTAMTTSAAAAAPNMGTYTLRPVVVLMAFLNLRLGYWLLNPDRVKPAEGAAPGLWERFRSFPAGWCYFRELVSALHERGRHVYLSDGGHLENTGAYELLRRRCKYIIVSDAEEDPGMRFGGLAALIRFARLDLGIEIDITLDDLTPDERQMSRRHSVLATIHYPARDGMPEERGTLVYIKSSLTGDEHPVIGQYRAENVLFPHESTANQAFGEDQFEAYRALGEHITRSLAGDSFVAHVGRDPVELWFLAIEGRLASSPHYDKLFPSLRDELEEVDSLLRTPEAAGYFAELYPELVAQQTQPESTGYLAELYPGFVPRKAPPEVAPAVLHEIAMRQIHLMASAFTLLELNNQRSVKHPWHRGWMQIFRRWMSSPSFRRVWIVGVQSYGPWFRQFCVQNFFDDFYLVWRSASREELAQNDLGHYKPPPQSPNQGFLYLLASVSVGVSAIPCALSACVGFKLSNDRATVWYEGIRARPGFIDLAETNETENSLRAWLSEYGLTLSDAPPPPELPLTGPPLKVDALALLRDALAASRASADAAPVALLPVVPPAEPPAA